MVDAVCCEMGVEQMWRDGGGASSDILFLWLRIVFGDENCEWVCVCVCVFGIDGIVWCFDTAWPGCARTFCARAMSNSLGQHG